MIGREDCPIYIIKDYTYIGNNQFEAVFYSYEDLPNSNFTTYTTVVPSSVIFHKVFSYFSIIDMSKFPDLATFMILGKEKYRFILNFTSNIAVQFSDKQHTSYTISLDLNNSTMYLSMGDDIKNLVIDKDVLFSFLDD